LQQLIQANNKLTTEWLLYVHTSWRNSVFS